MRETHALGAGGGPAGMHVHNRLGGRRRRRKTGGWGRKLIGWMGRWMVPLVCMYMTGWVGGGGGGGGRLAPGGWITLLFIHSPTQPRRTEAYSNRLFSLLPSPPPPPPHLPQQTQVPRHGSIPPSHPQAHKSSDRQVH